MAQDPQQALFAQFTRFVMDQAINAREWKMIAAEFGVLNLIPDTDRFDGAWDFAGDHRFDLTRRFLRRVYEEDEDTAYSLMNQVYSSVGGANTKELQRYPTLNVLENNTDNTTNPQVPTHSKPFLDIDNVPGTFYPSLIENINNCHHLGIYDATLILTRKLVENLLVDVLRRKYGTDRIELYYNPDSSEFHSFYELIEKFRELQSDFEHHSSEIGDGFIRELNSIRKPSNAEAHSIETDVSDDEMEDYRSTSIYLVKVLFHIRDSL